MLFLMSGYVLEGNKAKTYLNLVLMNTFGIVSYEVSRLLTPNSFLTPFCLWPKSVKR